MDGHIEVGRRSVSIAFESDRHAEDRIQLAYHRIETAATDERQSRSSVQASALSSQPGASTATETQG